MRGALMIMVVITLLIVGVLVIKNMGGGPSVGTTPSRAEHQLDRAQDAARDAAKKLGLTQQQLQKSE